MANSAQQLDKIKAIWDEHLAVAKTLPKLASGVSSAVDLMYASLVAGGQLLIAGNGGSAADAQHIAAELTGRFFLERRPFRALALHANTSSLTAVGNDYGYEQVFARELTAHARQGERRLLVFGSQDRASAGGRRRQRRRGSRHDRIQPGRLSGWGFLNHYSDAGGTAFHRHNGSRHGDGAGGRQFDDQRQQRKPGF